MSLTTAHSLWLAPVCLGLGIFLAWWSYRRAHGQDGFPRRLVLIMASCRAVAIALIAFFLLEPMVRTLQREVHKPVVVMLHDGSSSILDAGDTTAIRSTYPKALNEMRERLSDRFEVRAFTYGEAVREGLAHVQQDALTDISGALRAVYDRSSGPDLGAVIIDGDGIFNRGRDPRSDADRLGVPVLAIALGDTTVRPDLVVRAVNHNRLGYLGNDLPLLVRIESRRMNGVTTRVSVLHDGREIAGQDIALTGRNPFLEIPFTVRPERVGMQRYSISVRSLAGEVSTHNNRMDVLIEVLDDRQKILLLGAAPHPDLGAWRAALNGMEGYSTELAYANGFTGKAQDYDLVVLHNLPSLQHPQRELLQGTRAGKVPVCYILGSGADFNAVNAQNAGVHVSASKGAFNDAQALVNKAFDYFKLDPDQVRAIEHFPPLQVPFGQYELGRSATALLTQRIGIVATDYPLLAMSQQDERRQAVLVGEGTWRWRLADHQVHGDHIRFDRMVHKLVQFLALRVNKDRFRVAHEPRYTATEPVIFTAERYNATFEPVNDAEVTLLLKDGSGRDYPYTFAPSGTGYRLDAGRLPAGEYSWTARTMVDGAPRTLTGKVFIEALLVEQQTSVADHGLWRDITVRTDGKMVRPGDLDTLANWLDSRKDLVARSYAQPAFSDLISLRWLFFAVLGLLTTEWVLRRRNGAY